MSEEPFRENAFDILVIGAGILGTSSTCYLQRQNKGKKILLVDSLSAAAQGNTARSNAMFRNTFSSIDNQILCDASIDYYIDLQRSGRRHRAQEDRLPLVDERSTVVIESRFL